MLYNIFDNLFIKFYYCNILVRIIVIIRKDPLKLKEYEASHKYVSSKSFLPVLFCLPE